MRNTKLKKSKSKKWKLKNKFIFILQLWIAVVQVHSIFSFENIQKKIDQEKNKSSISSSHKVLIPNEYQSVQIQKIQLQGNKTIKNKIILNAIQKIFLHSFITSNKIKQAQKKIKDIYLKKGYPYVFVLSFLIKKNNEAKCYITKTKDLNIKNNNMSKFPKNKTMGCLFVTIRENPIQKFYIKGTRKKKDILSILRIKKGELYNIYEVEEATQRLFRSDLFKRHFKKIIITPYFLKTNGIMLGIHIYEKEPLEFNYLVANSQNNNAFAKFFLKDPSLYGTKNEMYFDFSMNFKNTLNSYGFFSQIKDINVLSENNPIRYKIFFNFEKFDFSITNHILSTGLYYGWNFSRISDSPIFLGFGYKFENRKIQFLNTETSTLLSNSKYNNMHKFSLVFEYDDKEYIIYRIFNNYLISNFDFIFSSNNDKIKKSFFQIRGNYWKNITDLFKWNINFQYLVTDDLLKEFINPHYFNYYLIESSQFYDINMSFFYINNYIIIGPFLGVLKESKNIDNNYYFGMSLKIIVFRFVNEFNFGIQKEYSFNSEDEISNLEKEFFFQLKSTGSF